MVDFAKKLKDEVLARAVSQALHPVDGVRIDVETFSECDLKKCGTYKYAEHPSTELLCVAFEFKPGPVHLWVPRKDLPAELFVKLVARVQPLATGSKIYVQLAVPEALREHVEARKPVHAFNAMFERIILNGVAGRKVGFPKLEINQTFCTAAKAAVAGLPRELGDAAEALGTHPKDEAGRADMLALSKPRTGKERRWTPENAPERFVNLYCYNMDDVRAEGGVDDAVPDLTERELETYRLDQRINDRGWAVDLEAVAAARFLRDQYREELAARCQELTADWLGNGIRPTQHGKLGDWVRANGYPQLPNMQAETVREILKDPACPDICKEVLQIYSLYGMKAVSKYDSIMHMVCADGCLHGMFMYYGAGTGRWSSKGVQLHNLFRPVIEDTDTAVEAILMRSLDWLRFLYDDVDPMRVLASCIRGMLIARPGKKLVFPDFSGVEARGNAWLWDEDWKLKAFREYDAGTGPDLYKVAYARAFRVLIEAVTKAQRQIGKVMELALGYEGGVGAFIKMIAPYGIDLDDLAEQVYPLLPEDVLESAEWMWNKFGKRSGLSRKVYIACDGLKQLWRLAHPKIKDGWKALKEAAVMAVKHKGKVFKCGKVMFSVRQYKKHEWLHLRLPSGRKLSYFKPRLEQTLKCNVCGNEHAFGELRTGDPCPEKIAGATTPTTRDMERYSTSCTGQLQPHNEGTVRYWGVDTDTRRWCETSSYGGKWDENIDQAFCRDLLVNALFDLEDAGYDPIGHVHDEPVTETDEDEGSLDEAGRIMCNQPSYADGMPIAIDGHVGKRYRK